MIYAMKTSHAFICLILIVIAFVGGLFLSEHRCFQPGQRQYSVQQTSGSSAAISSLINQQTSLGWKFKQAVSDGTGGVDLIFVK